MFMKSSPDRRNRDRVAERLSLMGHDLMRVDEEKGYKFYLFLNEAEQCLRRFTPKEPVVAEGPYFVHGAHLRVGFIDGRAGFAAGICIEDFDCNGEMSDQQIEKAVDRLDDEHKRWNQKRKEKQMKREKVDAEREKAPKERWLITVERHEWQEDISGYSWTSTGKKKLSFEIDYSPGLYIRHVDELRGDGFSRFEDALIAAIRLDDMPQHTDSANSSNSWLLK